ncbi:MAG: deoxyribose-phosphate aldolase [Phycisphaerae bacterium]|nr:deoxyribose-phosphate aldolase [Phycisphaerae bacterium]MCZ2398418.1 deoxyribose-phosphate aldolase [Phycisphaerae bacterium]NUQ48920.1 deoxyribose-phosphate aldolase [Phycisphaerae bacterium]
MVIPTDARGWARLIDHTLLKPEATAEQIDRLCDECIENDFVAACVNPVWVERAAARLDGAATRVCSVAGFPLGASLAEIKAAEASRAVRQGATEIDMVINIGALTGGDAQLVTRDIASVVDAVKTLDERVLVKVILETAVLDERQIVQGCRCTAEAQADFVKTSTGMHPAGGARVEHVALLRKHAAPLKVKAAGGIRDLRIARAMLEAGADRLGMSASVAVLAQLRNA